MNEIDYIEEFNDAVNRMAIVEEKFIYYVNLGLMKIDDELLKDTRFYEVELRDCEEEFYRAYKWLYENKELENVLDFSKWS